MYTYTGPGLNIMLTTQCMELVTSDVITQYKQHLKRYIYVCFICLAAHYIVEAWYRISQYSRMTSDIEKKRH